MCCNFLKNLGKSPSELSGTARRDSADLRTSASWREALDFIASLVYFLHPLFLHAADAFLCEQTDSISSFSQDAPPVYRHDPAALVQDFSVQKRWSDRTLVDRLGPDNNHQDIIVQGYGVDLFSARVSFLLACSAGTSLRRWDAFYDESGRGHSELPKIASSSPPPQIRRWTNTTAAFHTSPKPLVRVIPRTWACCLSGNEPLLPRQLHLNKEQAASSACEATSISNPSKAPNWDWSGDGHVRAVRNLISVSCNIVLSAFLECHAKGVVSASEMQDEEHSKQQGSRSRRQKSAQSRCKSCKRGSNSSGDDLDDEGDKHSPKRSRLDSKSTATSAVPPLACPFNKYDSRLFGPESPDESYHVCATCSFVTIAHLKSGPSINIYN